MVGKMGKLGIGSLVERRRWLPKARRFTATSPMPPNSVNTHLCRVIDGKLRLLYHIIISECSHLPCRCIALNSIVGRLTWYVSNCLPSEPGTSGGSRGGASHCLVRCLLVSLQLYLTQRLRGGCSD